MMARATVVIPCTLVQRGYQGQGLVEEGNIGQRIFRHVAGLAPPPKK